MSSTMISVYPQAAVLPGLGSSVWSLLFVLAKLVPCFPDLRMKVFDFGLVVFCFPDLIGKHAGQAINRHLLLVV
jgi:hypothetical protein